MLGSRYDKNKLLSFDERVDPATTALVVIDVQNDFALPQGACGRVGDDISPVAPMVERLNGLIEAAREASALIVFVRTIYDEPVLSPSLSEQYVRRGYPNSICLSGTPGAAFYGGIGPRENAANEVLVTKHRYSAFWGSSIDLVLRTNGVRTLILTGIATEVCVESTARDAFFRDYQVVVPSDCVGCYSPARQDASLVVIARSFGVVTTASEIKDSWKTKNSASRGWQPDARKARTLETAQAKLDPSHTAILFLNVDALRYDTAGSGALRDTLPALRELMANARQTKCLVIHAHRAIDAAGGLDQASTLTGFEPRHPEQTVFCHRTSAFADTALDVLLRSNCIRTLVVAGSATNREVESTAREAADKDYNVIVATDCVGVEDLESDDHSASLRAMSRYFADLMSSKDIARHWGTITATSLPSNV
jgi:nicotinamidase-related amidase